MILIAFALGLIWCIASYVQFQRTLQWWHCKQSFHLHHQAEQIREGLLQELFALRRGLELLDAHDPKSCATHQQDWLVKVEQIHQTLEQLSHRLSPAYVDESLPLAIQYFLKEWQQENSGFAVQFQVLESWQQESPEQTRIILEVLNDLLQIALSAAPAITPIQLHLEEHQRTGHLTLEITYLNTSTLTACCSSELVHLKRSFELLTSGWCTQNREGLTVRWSFYWQLD